MTAAGARQKKILVADDSAIFRAYWSRLLAGNPELVVVGTAENGEMAVRMAEELRPDLVILDLEMPVLDGLHAIPRLLKLQPKPKVLIASAFTTEGSAQAVEALAKGAADCLPKPSALDPTGSLESIRAELLGKIAALLPSQGAAPAPKTFDLTSSTLPFQALAIGCSTGGPNALEMLLHSMPAGFAAPIFITQHMPGFFLSALAERLAKQTGRPCLEPKDGEVVNARHIYLAPGGAHLLAERKEKGVALRLFNGPPENFCRPAVDPMFRSLANAFGRRLLAVVLTGMGEDGRNGAEEVVRHGGKVVVQDEASSVVWGMPGAVAKAGLASKILPLEQLGPWLWSAPFGLEGEYD